MSFPQGQDDGRTTDIHHHCIVLHHIANKEFLSLYTILSIGAFFSFVARETVVWHICFHHLFRHGDDVSTTVNSPSPVALVETEMQALDII